MQQFWYRSPEEYDAHVRVMLAAGWTMTHHQVNVDGTVSATWSPPLNPVAPSIPLAAPVVAPALRQTSVGVYDNDAEYRRDMARMLRLGWQVQNVAMTQNGRPLVGILMMGIFAKQRIKYTVIYVR